MVIIILVHHKDLALGGNSNTPNDGGSGSYANRYKDDEHWISYRDRVNTHRRNRTIARRIHRWIARGNPQKRAIASAKKVAPSHTYSVANTKQCMSLATKKKIKNKISTNYKLTLYKIY